MLEDSTMDLAKGLGVWSCSTCITAKFLYRIGNFFSGLDFLNDNYDGFFSDFFVFEN